MVLLQCLLLAFLGVNVLVAGDPLDSETKIFGGFEIDIHQAPWQVSLKSGGFHSCGGIIISDLWVLTAAHCTYLERAEKLTLQVGSSSRKEGGKVYKVQQIVNHEKYSKPQRYCDIGLLKAASRIEFGRSVAPVKLPQLGAKHPPPGTTLRVSGWGATEKGGTNMLRAVDIVLHDFSVCRKLTGMTARDTRLCVGDPGKNNCFGDSGGPLVKGDLLVGIASCFGGTKCAVNPHVYSDVAAFREWIKKHSGV